MNTFRKAVLSLAVAMTALLGMSANTHAIQLTTQTTQPTAQIPSDFDLAFHHAPIHFQDTDSSDSRADFITRFNYDGNFVGTDNWENLSKFPLPAYAYYSVVETRTHWLITYGFSHPRDWNDAVCCSFDSEHENDMEGVLTIVRKDGSVFGKLEGIVTVAHTDFFSYTPADSPLRNGQEDIDGPLSFSSLEGSFHFLTAQEAEGHGLKAFPFAGDFQGRPQQDGIIYYPSKTAEEPESGNDRNVTYQLIDLFAPKELWQFQLDQAGLTYASWGTFKGDDGGGCGGVFISCGTDAANAPWAWDDETDGLVHAGEMALDPAHLVQVYFDNLGNFDPFYLRNPYIEGLRDRGFGTDQPLPIGWPSDLNLLALYHKLIPRPIPEPSTLSLLFFGALGAGLAALKRT